MTETVKSTRLQSDCDRFIEKAEVAGAAVSKISSFEEAVDYAVELCENRQLNRLAIQENDSGIDENEKKIIAARTLMHRNTANLNSSVAIKVFSVLIRG